MPRSPDILSPVVPAASPGHTDTASVQGPVSAPSRSILVIDDSALVREAARIALSPVDGWQTVTVASGEEGIELASSERWSAILLDVEMPGMDGIEVAKRLHEAPATGMPPIVLLSAHKHIENSPRLRDISIAGAIAKPFDISELPHQVAILLGWPV
jgi:CheY-like chemotaxis protein